MIESAFYRVSTGYIGDNIRVEIVQWMWSLDEDFVILEPKPCSPNYSAEIVPSGVCDYSHSACGTKRNDSWSQDCRSDWCNSPGLDWDDLEIGAINTILVCNHSRNPCTTNNRGLRVDLDFEILQTGFEVWATNINCEFDIWLSEIPLFFGSLTTWFVPNELTTGATYSAMTEKIPMCPRSSPMGTRFLLLWGRAFSQIIEQLTYVRVFPIAPVLGFVPQNRCSGFHDPQWTCVDDGVPFIMRLDGVNTTSFHPGEGIWRFAFPLPSTCPLIAAVRIMFTWVAFPTQFFIDTTPKFYNQSSSLLTDARWALTRFICPVRGTYTFPCTEKPDTIYITIINPRGATTVPTYVEMMNTASRALLRVYDLETLPITELSGMSMNWFHLKCPDGAGNMVWRRPCQILVTNTFAGFTPAGCDATTLFRVVPKDDITYWMHPRPQCWTAMIEPWVDQPLVNRTYDARKLGMSKLMFTDQGGVIQRSPPTDIHCEVHLRNPPIVSAKGWDILENDLPPSELLNSSNCVTNLTEFDLKASRMGFFLDQYNQKKTDFFKWAIGEASLDPIMQGCDDYLSQMIATIPQQKNETTDVCVTSIPGDPCCDSSALWTHCCRPHDFPINSTFIGEVFEEEVGSRCELVCGTILAQEYKSILNPSRCFTNIPTFSELQRQESRGWIWCMAKIFKGASASNFIPCASDDDCSDPYMNISYRCDLISHRCLSNYSSLVRSFALCLQEQLSGHIKSLFDLDISSLGFGEALLTQTAPMCVPLEGVDLTIMPHFSLPNPCTSFVIDECGSLKVVGISTISPDYPYKCLVRQICSFVTGLVYLPTVFPGCDEEVCRVRTSSNIECPTQICAVCFGNQSQCYSLEDLTGTKILSQQECEKAPICVLANGTVFLGSESQCIGDGICTVPVFHQGSPMAVQSGFCDGAPCTNKQQCELLGGWCKVEEVFQDFPNESQVCFTPHPNPFNAPPTCSQKNGTWMSYPAGCVTNSSSVNCTQWIAKKHFSRGECEEFGVGCRISTPDLITFYNETVFSLQNQNECLCPGGNPGVVEPVWPWIKARWTPGKIVPGKWITSGKMNPYASQQLMSFKMIEDLFQTAIVSWNEFWVLSLKDCQNYPVLNSITDFLCACQDNEMSVCAENEFPNVMSVTIVCPGESRVLDLGTVSLNFSTESVSSPNCSSLTVNQDLGKNWIPKKSRPLSTSFFYNHPRKDSEIIFNQKNAVVGTLLNVSGIMITGSFKSFEICAEKVGVDATSVSSYPLWNFAIGIGQDKLRVFSQVMIQERNSLQGAPLLCATIDENFLSSFQGSVSLSLFLTRVSADWETQNNSLSSTEFILFATAAGLFWVFFGFVAIVGLSTISLWENMWAKEDYLLLISLIELLIFGLVRGILFAMIATEADLNSIGENILLELPTFLYFSLVIEQILVFQFPTNTSTRKQFSMCCGLILLLTFVGVIVLLQVVNNQAPETTCRGRIIQESSGLSHTDELRITYKSIIGVFSLGSAVTLSIFGMKALAQMREFRIKNQHVLKGLEAYELPVLVKTLVVALSLAGNCLGFIVYYVVDNTTPYFVIFLFCTEILPLFIFAGVMKIEAGLKFGTLRQGTSTGPSTVDL